MRTYDRAPEQLHRLMQARAWTLESLSRRTQIDPQTLRAYLTGRRRTISTRNMAALAAAFEMPLADLMDLFTESCQFVQ